MAVRLIGRVIVNAAIYNPQIQISAESETKRSIFRERTKRSVQKRKARNTQKAETKVL